jgi:hypothetical protein
MRLENQSQNINKYLSVPDLNNLINKHNRIINSQHKYSHKDKKEREFLKSLLDRL